MPVDIRATVSCSLGTVISGNVNDEYVQGTGLIKCSGTVVINAIITPAIGTAVTFSYTKAGVTRTIPRKLRVLSSFADPFRRTTSVELGCKLTYLSDKRDSIDWTAFDDDENTLTESDAEIITIPIRAQAVAAKCLSELGISGSLTLTNKFSIAKFDLSPGYVQVLSDLLVSESLCGYLDANEALQVFSLDQAGGTGPVLDATQLVDIGKIGVGQLPGEAVTVSYSSLKLKRDVQLPSGGNGGGDGGIIDQPTFRPWEVQSNVAVYNIDIPYTNYLTGEPANILYSILELSDTTTTYIEIATPNNGVVVRPSRRVTEFVTGLPSVCGNLYTEYLSNGIPAPYSSITRTTYEDYQYDVFGNEILCDRYVIGAFGFLLGSIPVPIVFDKSNYVTLIPNAQISLEREITTSIYSGSSRQVSRTLYQNWIKTQAGQQAIAAARPSLTDDYYVGRFLNSIAVNGLVIVDSRVDIESYAAAPPSAPTRAEINNFRNVRIASTGGDPNNGYRTEGKAELELAVGSATAQRRIELSLPYAPDDTFIKTGSTYSSIESDAPQKAQLYGRVQNRLLLGNRNGMSIQVAPEILPGAPFSPFVIRSGSTSALYRTNGTSWTFDAQGLVASTDALFWGGVGGNAGESWFPVAPGITTLPTTPGTTTVNITDGSGNVIGSYEEMEVPGTVPVAQETALLQATLRVRPVVTGLNYALALEGDITATVKAKVVVTGVKSITPPVAAVTVAGIAPAVSTGARVSVPVAAVSVAGVAPALATGVSVAVPTGAVTMAGVAPDLVGRQRTQVLMPVAGLSVTGLAPQVAGGASVAVPAAGVTVAGVVPVIKAGAFDPDFASVSLLLHMDGSNGGTTFTDSSSNARTITRVGNTQTSTAQFKYGTASALFDGNGDYLTTPYSTSLYDWWTSSYTIEAWVYAASWAGWSITSLNTIPCMVGNMDPIGGTAYWSFGPDSAGKLKLYYFNGSEVHGILTTATVPTSQWSHIAAVKTPSGVTLYINGTSSGGTFSIGGSPMSSVNVPLSVGSLLSTSINGYIDDLRITKGVARYTSIFTPPAAPFPDK